MVPVKSITIISVFGHRNKGDAAIFANLVSQVEAISPDARISAVVRNPRTERVLYPDLRIEEQLLCSSARSRWLKFLQMLWFALGSLAWMYWRRLGSFLLPARKRRAIEAISEAGLVLSCGGGFLHDSYPGFVIHLFEMHVAQRLGKPLVLVSQSIGPFRSAWSRRLAHRVLDRCEAILPRERISLKYLTGQLHITRPRIELTPDLAFLNTEARGGDSRLRTEIVASIPEGARIVGVTARYWNFPSRRSEARYLNEDFHQKLGHLLDSLVETTGLNVVFFPQAITRDFNDFDDRAVARRVAATMAHRESVLLIEDDISVAEIRFMIGRCELFVGTRMHSNIFALTAGVPTLAISYLPKTPGIMELAGLGDLVVGMDADLAEFIDVSRKLLTRQSEIRELLRDRIPEIQTTISGTLSRVISGHPHTSAPGEADQVPDLR